MNRRQPTQLLGSGLSSIVSQGSKRGFIKSVQVGTINLATVATNTATITAVDPNNSLIYYEGLSMTVTNVNLVVCFATVTLTNSTTVTATQSGSFGNTVTIGFTVVEFYPGVLRSAQRGFIAASGSTTATATITAVDTTKAQVMLLGQLDGSGAPNSDSASARLTLTNATTVTVTTGAASSAGVQFQVAEYY